MQAVMRWLSGPVLPTDKIVEALEALVMAGDRIVLEGDNQKQADFLSRSLVKGKTSGMASDAAFEVQADYRTC